MSSTKGYNRRHKIVTIRNGEFQLNNYYEVDGFTISPEGMAKEVLHCMYPTSHHLLEIVRYEMFGGNKLEIIYRANIGFKHGGDDRYYSIYRRFVRKGKDFVFY